MKPANVPLVAQESSVDCGLACLAMVAMAHGLNVDMPSVRREFPPDRAGTTLSTLLRVAERVGLRPQPLRAEVETLGDVALPAVLHWNMNHFVVLCGLLPGGALVNDPARGRLRVTNRELEESFTGVVLELTPSPGVRPINRRTMSAFVRTRLTSARGALAELGALALALEILMLLSPFAMQILIDAVIPAQLPSLLLPLAATFLLLAAIQGFAVFSRGKALANLLVSWTSAWSVDVFRHVCRLPQAFFQTRQIGEIASRFSSLEAMQSHLSGQAVGGILDGLFALLSAAAMLYYSPQLACIVFGCVAIYVASRFANVQRVRSVRQQLILQSAVQQNLFVETVGAALPLQVNNRSEVMAIRFSNRVRELAETMRSLRYEESRFHALGMMVLEWQRLCTLFAGVYLVTTHSFTLGGLFAFMAFGNQFAQRAARTIDFAVELQSLRIHTGRVQELMDAPPEKFREPIASAAPRDSSVELVDIDFRYDESSPWIARRLKLRVPDGSCIAITGASGCGKTTLGHLILGALDPISGDVRIGGERMVDIGKDAARDKIGAVLQGDRLLAGTIAENIAFFDPEPDLIRVREVAQIALVDAEIMSLPLGYRTIVGGLTRGVSGGQEQRILLARALYRNPTIVILDEATSHLDAACESGIARAIAALKMTRIIIAHRRETIEQCEVAYRMEGGRLLEIKSSGDLAHGAQECVA